mmetsp:Transcript_93894/g.163063  ORF Transcript_93894/g.163063 Transcript_93894/m.163063 type:complete len:218 (+) Transcript_93894:102-755(+)
MGGMKNTRKKQQRKEMKRTLKACERCPHCRKQVFDLEEHLRMEHANVCARCGKRFNTQIQWKQHMKDMHGLNSDAAVRDDRNRKIERWLKSDKAAGASSGVAAAAAEAAAPGDAAMETSETQSQAAVCPPCPPAVQPAPAQHRHLCDNCGAEVFLAVDLTEQGLTFQCCLVGRQCNSNGLDRVSARPTFFSPPATTPATDCNRDAAFDMELPSDDDL